jgi:hypothetical protein
VPLPDEILHNPKCLNDSDPVRRHFIEVFSQYASYAPAHTFGTYINLSPIVFAVAILEEFVVESYSLRTGGASLKRPDGRSRSLITYFSIMAGIKCFKDLVPHHGHIVIGDIDDITSNVVFLAKRRNKISHAYRQAKFDYNVASKGMPRLRKAVEFVDKFTELLLEKAKPRLRPPPGV